MTEQDAASDKLEQVLAQAVRQGISLDLKGTPDVPMVADRPVLRPAVIMRVALEASRAGISGPGIVVRGAHVDGDLYIIGYELRIGIELRDCTFAGAVIGDRARLRRLSLQECTVGHISLVATEISEDLIISRSTVFGQLRMPWCKIGNQVDMSGAQLLSSDGPALMAEGIEVSGSMHISQGFIANGAGRMGAVNLGMATISGQLNMAHALVMNHSGSAIMAESIRVGHGIVARDALYYGNSTLGAVCLHSAQLGGNLDVSGSRVTNNSGPGVTCEVASIAGSILAGNNFRCAGNSSVGAVILHQTTIGNSLQLYDSEIKNSSGSAIMAEYVDIGGGMNFGAHVRTRGSGAAGTLNFAGLKSRGQIQFKGSIVENGSGPAVVLQDCEIGGALVFSETFVARGTGRHAAVQLGNAHVRSGLHLDNAKFCNQTPNGSALSLESARVEGRLFVGELDTLGLTRWSGLTYDGLPVGLDIHSMLRLFKSTTLVYDPQPYRQLATACHAAGHENDTKIVYLAQQRDYTRRGLRGEPAKKVGRWLLGVFIGYGWRPFRALYWLLILFCAVALGSVIFLAPNHLIQTAQSARPAVLASGRNCSMTESVGFAADVVFPVVKIGGRGRCDIPPDRASPWLLGGVWLTQLAGWALATLFVAGYTGIVRKT